jgi:DNA-binding MarR family transcriptional regulator
MTLRFVLDLQRATHRVGLYVERLRGLGVTQGEAHILAHLHAAGSATVAELHRALAHKRSTLTSILDRLEGRGLVERETSPEDRRTFVVALTREGKRAAKEVYAHLAEIETAVAGRVSPEALEGFAAVVAAIEDAATEARP